MQLDLVCGEISGLVRVVRMLRSPSTTCGATIRRCYQKLKDTATNDRKK